MRYAMLHWTTPDGVTYTDYGWRNKLLRDQQKIEYIWGYPSWITS